MVSLARLSLRSALVFAAALAVLGLAAGCLGPGEVAGVWEGESGPSRLVFEFAPDGNAALSVTVGKETNTTRCAWERVERRIRMTNPSGRTRWFTIIECTDDKLVLRLDVGRNGIAHLHRRG